MSRRARLAALLWALACAWAAPTLVAAQASSPFADWAAIVVAGDWHAHSGGPTEAFDNARRDVSQGMIDSGFAAENLRQFSVRPSRYRDTQPLKTDPRVIYNNLAQLTDKARTGCLLYFSSHGAPQGVVVDENLLSPRTLAAMVDNTCKDRPTVVVMSACFSGVFIPDLARPNRMILTAARPDRTSFGCGEDDKYPYFDDCFLRSLPTAANFAALGAEVQTCVAAREIKEGVRPPSQPQLWIGPALRPMLPLYGFQRRVSAGD